MKSENVIWKKSHCEQNMPSHCYFRDKLGCTETWENIFPCNVKGRKLCSYSDLFLWCHHITKYDWYHDTIMLVTWPFIGWIMQAAGSLLKTNCTKPAAESDNEQEQDFAKASLEPWKCLSVKSQLSPSRARSSNMKRLADFFLTHPSFLCTAFT